MLLEKPLLYHHKNLSLWLGSEYTSHDFTILLAFNETIHQTSCIDTPQEDGVV